MLRALTIIGYVALSSGFALTAPRASGVARVQSSPVMDEAAVEEKPIRADLQGAPSYSKEEILAIARGEVFGKNNARLPLPPMLMMDRITEVSEDGGLHGKGHVVAELDINPDLWFFPCHFDGNPIMPGCLGLDALWQLTGFNLAWRGWPGAGYALGVGNVKFTGMVRPDRKVLRYEVDFTKTVKSWRLTMGVADGKMYADGELLYETTDMKVAFSDA